MGCVAGIAGRCGPQRSRKVSGTPRPWSGRAAHSRLHKPDQMTGRSGVLSVSYRRRGVILRSLIWQFCGCLAGAAEIWIALWLLGSPVGVTGALAIEAVIAAVSSAGFLVPGAIGIQEATFLVIGGVLGLPPSTAFALAVARRLRDAVVFFPGLWAWQMSEKSGGAAGISRSIPAL